MRAKQLCGGALLLDGFHPHDSSERPGPPWGEAVLGPPSSSTYLLQPAGQSMQWPCLLTDNSLKRFQLKRQNTFAELAAAAVSNVCYFLYARWIAVTRAAISFMGPQTPPLPPPLC